MFCHVDVCRPQTRRFCCTNTRSLPLHHTCGWCPPGKKSDAANRLSGRLKGVCAFAVLKFEPCGILKGLFMQMTRIYLGLLRQTVCFTIVLIRAANVSDVIMLSPWFLRLSASCSLEIAALCAN